MSRFKNYNTRFEVGKHQLVDKVESFRRLKNRRSYYGMRSIDEEAILWAKNFLENLTPSTNKEFFNNLDKIEIYPTNDGGVRFELDLDEGGVHSYHLLEYHND